MLANSSDGRAHSNVLISQEVGGGGVSGYAIGKTTGRAHTLLASKIDSQKQRAYQNRKVNS